MKQWYVNYHIKNWNEIPILMQTMITATGHRFDSSKDHMMSAGPYSSKQEAESHRYDIAGYEGAFGVFIERRSTLEEQEP